MGTVYQEPTLSEPSQAEDLTPKAHPTKRLFSNRDSHQIDSNPYTNYNESPLEERHSDKRHRNTDWPLPSSPSSPTSVTSRPPLQNRSRNGANSNSNTPRRAASQQRPSKFLEGSMNDRISAVPPTPYLDPEGDENEYEAPRGRKIARPRKFTKRGTSSVAGTSSIGDSEHTKRESSIFRFGKSIAQSFNPSNWGKIWGGNGKGGGEKDDVETAQMKVLRERQSRAERIYRELKESGQFADSAIVFPPSAPASAVKKDGGVKHDSGVEFDDELDAASTREIRGASGTSLEDKRKGMIFLEAPKFLESVYGESPGSSLSQALTNTSNHSSPNKSSFHFKKPSLSNLKRTFASNSSTNLADLGGGNQARRIPSRKDLQKQQKLVKRVSDLEGKLMAARRQLEDALGEPLPGDISQISLFSQESQVLDDTTPPMPPAHHTPVDRSMERVVRKPFVPGALASLPSERLLAGYIQDDEENEEGIGMAVTVNHRQQSDEKPKQPRAIPEESPAWLGRQLNRRGSASSHRPGSSSSNRAFKSLEEKNEDSTPTVKKKVRSNKSDVATTITSLSEPSTRDSDPNDDDYEQGEPEPEPEEETLELEIEEDDKTLDATPKPAQPKRISPPSKKRKSRFDGLGDDGGIYKPGKDQESDPESGVKKPKSTPRKQQASKSSTPQSNKSQSSKLMLQPRKLQKISPTQSKDPNVDAPPTRAPPPPPESPPNNPTAPTRAPPPPPSQASNSTSSKHPVRASSLKATLKSPPPNRVLTKPPPMPSRQQSVSPPPSSAFMGVGAELEYKKPSLQRRDLDEDEDEGVPPMPEMPKTVRLASGEVIDIAKGQAQSQVLTPTPTKRGGQGKGKGSVVSASNSRVSKSSAASGSGGKLIKERRGSKRLENRKKENLLVEAVENAAAAGEEKMLEKGGVKEKGLEREKKSFEWPDDVF